MNKSQCWYVSHAETIMQNVVGQIIAYIVFACYGIDTATSLKFQITFLIVAYVRGYLIRRMFNYIGACKNEKT